MRVPPAPVAPLPLIAALAAVLGFAVLQGVAALIAQGVFEYPLDDVYIHLAMAEGLSSGGYGINAGEPASAASSILYPFLLAPFPGSALQRLLPLALNLLAVAGAGALWGRAVALAGLSGVAGVALAALGPLALNIPGVGFTGMENSLHALAALATVLGLWRFLQSGQIGALLALGAVFAPLLRLEGLALSGLACLVVLGAGRWRAGLALGAAVLAPVLGFALFLTGLGLAPLPGSVIAKVALAAPEAGPLMRLWLGLWANLAQPAGGLLAALSGLCVLLAVLPGQRGQGRGSLLLVLGLAGGAHLLAGQIGWMHRYEHYIVLAQVAGLVLVAGPVAARRAQALPVPGPALGPALGLVAVALLAAALAFWPALLTRYLWNPRAIHLQQAQMARFAQEWVQAPVAVNDLGRVAWGNPDPVLDLYGLGSPAALALRLAPGGPAPGWAGPLARAAGIELAMIYDHWFGTAVGPDWVRLGTLTQTPERGALGGWRVSFYAVDPAAAPRLRALMAAFAPSLPAGAQLTLAPAAP